MKIALAQLNYHIGNFEGNFERMAERVAEAKAAGADLIVFGELAISGYPPRDFLEFGDFVRRCDTVVGQLAELARGIAIILGGPSVNPKIEGKDLFNSAFLLEEGRVAHTVHKTLLPNYDIFDEYRYFEPNRRFYTVPFQGRRIALTICEDLWNVGNENPMYPDCPMDRLMELPEPERPNFIINISASPFDHEQAAERIAVMQANCTRYGLPLFYVNHVGAQTELLFDGGSLVLDAQGVLVDEMRYFEEDLRVYDLDEIMAQTGPGSTEKESADPAEQSTDTRLSYPQFGSTGEQPRAKYELVRKALVTGVRNYFGKLGFEQAILGLSGGIDSALTLVLAAEALGPANVLSVLLPSPFSSAHSVDDSIALCENLNAPYLNLSIGPAYEKVIDELAPHFGGKPFDVTEENIQARLRALYLMALSNKHGYILLNTSNKSEAAVGYGTLYGDMCGGLSVIGDLYKTEVYELSRHINRDREIIPPNIIEKEPSAELRHDQKDSDSLPPYEELDAVLYQYIERRKGPREIVAMGFDDVLVRRVLRLVNMSEYKRHQTPPILRVSTKAFGMGRRLPIVGKYLS